MYFSVRGSERWWWAGGVLDTFHLSTFFLLYFKTRKEKFSETFKLKIDRGDLVNLTRRKLRRLTDFCHWVHKSQSSWADNAETFTIVFSINPTMKLFHSLINRFTSRLIGNLSSLTSWQLKKKFESFYISTRMEIQIVLMPVSPFWSLSNHHQTVFLTARSAIKKHYWLVKISTVIFSVIKTLRQADLGGLSSPLLRVYNGRSELFFLFLSRKKCSKFLWQELLCCLQDEILFIFTRKCFSRGSWK